MNCNQCGANPYETRGSIVWNPTNYYCNSCFTLFMGSSARIITDTDTAFKQRVLDAVKDDIVLDASEGWVLWLDLTTPHGFYTAASLRVIADELDRRNEELFECT